jgi:hypothetical protein
MGSNARDPRTDAASLASSVCSTSRARATARSRSIGCTDGDRSLESAPGNRSLIPSRAVATDPPGDLRLAPLGSEPRSLDAWLTTFHLAAVILDPYTYESAWLLETAGRILEDFRGADCRIAFVVTANEDDAREFLGPWAQRMLTFADPDRDLVKAIGVNELPAFVHLRQDRSVAALAEGWDPPEWRDAVSELAKAMSWTRPNIPGPADPKPYPGSPALGA